MTEDETQVGGWLTSVQLTDRGTELVLQTEEGATVRVGGDAVTATFDGMQLRQLFDGDGQYVTVTTGAHHRDADGRLRLITDATVAVDDATTRPPWRRLGAMRPRAPDADDGLSTDALRLADWAIGTARSTVGPIRTKHLGDGTHRGRLTLTADPERGRVSLRDGDQPPEDFDADLGGPSTGVRLADALHRAEVEGRLLNAVTAERGPE